MSGFEIAGVVLGAWPVLDQGLKFYKARSKNIFRHEQVMNRLIRRLHVEYARFRNSCEKLISGLADDSELEDLLENPTEDAWSNSLANGLERKLKARLGCKVFASTSTIEGIAVNLFELREIVGIEPNKRIWQDQTKYKKPKWHAETWKKIKDCLNHDKHMELLADIKESNTELEQLTPGVVEMDVEEPVKRARVDVSAWESVRRSANSLYCALCSGWFCQCLVAHSARLRLEARVGVATKAGQPRFSITFSYPAGGAVSWRHTEIEPDGEDDADAAPASRPSRVSFAQTHLPQAQPAPSKNHITSLCDELVRCSGSHGQSCIGFVVEERRKHYIHLVQSPSTKSDHTISLYELLVNHGRAPSLQIQLKDRFKMALILASSLLQFHTTPWLGTRWTARDVEVAPTSSDTRLGDSAFVSSSFTSGGPAGNRHAHGGGDPGPRQWAIRNEAIFALGVMLLEMSISTTLQSKQTDEDRALRELADCNTAHRIAKQVEDNNVQEWNKVVRKCLTCDFGEEPDFGQKTFRERFYEGVVAPLQHLYELV